MHCLPPCLFNIHLNKFPRFQAISFVQVLPNKTLYRLTVHNFTQKLLLFSSKKISIQTRSKYKTSKVLAAVQEYDGVKSGRQLLKVAKRGDLNHTLIRIYMQVAFSTQPGSTITAEGTRATVNAYENYKNTRRHISHDSNLEKLNKTSIFTKKFTIPQ